ncbi:MAG: MFS transporter [Alphaproteobacteria bacterium]
MRIASIPRVIWTLGFVSMLMDISSEMIHSLLPVFLVAVLGASPVALGLMEGLAEGMGSILKLFSGAVSDRMGRRKPLALLGYGLSAAAKPLFAVAQTVGLLFAARFIDRVGKGIRGAPRDALIADLVPAAMHDAAYGLRQSLDTIGALAGPLIAFILMMALMSDIRSVFALATLPAAACVLLLALGVREPDRNGRSLEPRQRFHWADVRRLGRRCYMAVGLAAVVNLARPGDAFLLLRAESVHLAIAFVPLMMVLMNIAYAGTAFPVGLLAGRIGRPALVALGIGLLLTANLVLAFAQSAFHVSIGAILWGLHMGCTQGLLTAMVADSAEPRLRGTAFGLYHAATGLAVLVASTMAGGLWAALGPAEAFLASTVIAAIALIALAVTVRYAAR